MAAGRFDPFANEAGAIHGVCREVAINPVLKTAGIRSNARPLAAGGGRGADILARKFKRRPAPR